MMQIDLNALQVVQDEFAEITKKIRICLLELERMQYDIKRWCLEDEVLRKIDREQENLFEQMYCIRELESALEKICMLYNRSENQLIHYAEQKIATGKSDFIGVKEISYLTAILRNIFGE